jgi:hypothetical protein
MSTLKVHFDRFAEAEHLKKMQKVFKSTFTTTVMSKLEQLISTDGVIQQYFIDYYNGYKIEIIDFNIMEKEIYNISFPLIILRKIFSTMKHDDIISDTLLYKNIFNKYNYSNYTILISDGPFKNWMLQIKNGIISLKINSKIIIGLLAPMVSVSTATHKIIDDLVILLDELKYILIDRGFIKSNKKFIGLNQTAVAKLTEFKEKMEKYYGEMTNGEDKIARYNSVIESLTIPTE